jgi:hypothetical protein
MNIMRTLNGEYPPRPTKVMTASAITVLAMAVAGSLFGNASWARAVSVARTGGSAVIAAEGPRHRLYSYGQIPGGT